LFHSNHGTSLWLNLVCFVQNHALIRRCRHFNICADSCPSVNLQFLVFKIQTAAPHTLRCLYRTKSDRAAQCLCSLLHTEATWLQILYGAIKPPFCILATRRLRGRGPICLWL
jgi:hypothetical protein